MISRGIFQSLFLLQNVKYMLLEVKEGPAGTTVFESEPFLFKRHAPKCPTSRVKRMETGI
jgi:hypothetical protein